MASTSLCSEPGCGGKVYGRGWCSKHYQRWWKRGRLDSDYTIEGQPLAFLTDLISSKTNECIFWPYARSGEGRAQVWFEGRVQRAHRVICEMVHGTPPTDKHEAAHSCGNGHLACVTPNHLSWKTRTANEHDKLAHGTHNRGARNGQAKLTEQQVSEIFKLNGIEPKSHIAKRFGISRSTVQLIHKGERWSHLTN